jgi:uncharacterized SAM-binding protein YcdF (DUF218 family)
MIKNKNIICISSIDWDFIWQGHQEIMSIFAKNGNCVLFIENTGVRPPTFKDIPRIKKRITNWLKGVKGFRKVADNLYVYSPLILPFPYSRIAKWANKFLMLKALRNWTDIMKFDNPIIWTFLATGTAVDIIESLKKELLIYCCIADWAKLTSNPRKFKETEAKVIKQSDLIFVQGEDFKNNCLQYNENVFEFLFGINAEIFENFKKEKTPPVPAEIKDIPRPVIGYVGGIHRHIDFDLIQYIVGKCPDWSIVMVGPVQAPVSRFDGIKNVHFVGKKDYSLLPAYINQFDVCIIPYILNEYTRTVYPTKINEYHIMGKPIVSAYLPEVEKFNKDNLILIAKDREEFLEKVQSALRENNDGLINARIHLARGNSWELKLEEMSKRIEETLGAKTLITPPKWQQQFLEIYSRWRKKIFQVAFSVLFLWGVVFYTPLMWYLAEPLRIIQQPQRADAILVFAGGVGESGQAGQGYEERVNYAVELYKKGYADNLIFSSGTRSTFSEPYVMKVLAISLGVPEKAILLEDKAANTYENVRFSDSILDARKWKKAVLISSPYHMRRALLVFRKVAPDKDIIYSPVIDSQFYSHGGIDEKGKRKWKQINLRQIRAIIHEYAAILYYWLEGYI